MKVSKRYKRQFDLVKPANLTFPIVVIGIGGIGSWVTLALAKMGCTRIFVIDPDIIEDHNIATQFYKEKQKGETKVKALIENVKEFTGIEIKGNTAKWEKVFGNQVVKDHLSDYVIISALDSMRERKALFRYFEENGFPNLYVDARMGGELLRVFTVLKHNLESYTAYRKKMEDKKLKVYKERCTERAIVYNTFLSGAVITNIIKKFANTQPLKFETIVDISNEMLVL